MGTFMERDMFLGTQIELIIEILENNNSNEKRSYYAINTDCMLKYWEDEEYRGIINQQENVVYADGMGIIFSQKLLKLPTASERIATTDLFPALMEEINIRQERKKIFLLGSKGDSAEKVRKAFTLKYPAVQFIGAHHGYFDKERESQRVIELINQAEPDILFVGFGNPMQEKWVNTYFHQINVPTIITCGGLFDYYAQNVKRAPLIMQKTGFEWLYRLYQEPSRLFRRYVFGNLSFLIKLTVLKLLK